jgi:hypothetical protein
MYVFVYLVYPNWNCFPPSSIFCWDELGKSVTNVELCIVPILVIVDLQHVFISNVGIFYKHEI